MANNGWPVCDFVDVPNFLNNKGLVKMNCPGDGHCIFHSFVVGCFTQSGINASYSCVLQDIRNEFTNHVDEYAQFLFSDDYFGELEAFLTHKSFNRELVELVPLMLANVYGVSIGIVNADSASNRAVIITVFPQRSTVTSTIYLLRSGDHYDGLKYSYVSTVTQHTATRQPSAMTDKI